MTRSFADQADSATDFDPEAEFENVIEIEMGRQRRQEALERKKRVEARRGAEAKIDALEGLPRWPGGLDDLEVE